MQDWGRPFPTLRTLMAAGFQCARRSPQDTHLRAGRMATGFADSGSASYLLATCTPRSRSSLILRSKDCVWSLRARPIPIPMISVSSSAAAPCRPTESAEKNGWLNLVSWLPIISVGDWCLPSVALISLPGVHLMIHALAAVQPLISWLTFPSYTGRQSRGRMEAFLTQQKQTLP